MIISRPVLAPGRSSFLPWPDCFGRRGRDIQDGVSECNFARYFRYSRVSFLTPHTRFVRFGIQESTRRNGLTRLLL